MRKKVIQVPFDDRLLTELNTLSKKQDKTRSELIREACARYVAEVEEAELDRIYVEGYRKIPDDPAFGEAGLELLKEIFPEESW